MLLRLNGNTEEIPIPEFKLAQMAILLFAIVIFIFVLFHVIINWNLIPTKEII